MSRPCGLHIVLAVAGACIGTSAAPAEPTTRTYRATLRSSGGDLPFSLELSGTGHSQSAVIVNGSERISVPDVSQSEQQLRIAFPQYESEIEARFEKGGVLRGTWKKRTAADQPVTMAFSAEPGPSPRFRPIFKITEDVQHFAPVAGRWAVQFAGDAEPAVGMFRSAEGKEIEGTFLTTTGDYRYLAGSYEYGRLRLSCFDGSHAFLFDAMMQPDGTLKGDFWSGPKYHDTWTAKRDDNAALPDGFALTKVRERARLGELKFPDPSGKPRSLADSDLLGKATIIEVFGSWCPNCADAADYLAELDRKYGPRGLKIVGLAFEASGDVARNARQVRIFMERHGAKYPVLIGGLKDRAKASAALPVLDELKAYPTFLFVRGDGTIRSVYTGYSGPATGEEHARLRKRFEAEIEALLGEAAGK